MFSYTQRLETTLLKVNDDWLVLIAAARRTRAYFNLKCQNEQAGKKRQP